MLLPGCNCRDVNTDIPVAEQLLTTEEFLTHEETGLQYSPDAPKCLVLMLDMSRGEFKHMTPGQKKKFRANKDLPISPSCFPGADNLLMECHS